MVRGLFVLVFALAATVAGCSRGGDSSNEAGAVVPSGSKEAAQRVQSAARALSTRDPSVDYVAAEMEGVIKGRTASQALIHYDGYRVTFTTPKDRVTRIQFDFIEAKPTMRQLADSFGPHEEVGDGWLFRHSSRVTGANIRIFAEPQKSPATETSLVRRVLVEGEKVL
jgi:hypothetical protein